MRLCIETFRSYLLRVTSQGGRGHGVQGNAAQVTVTAHQCLTWALTVTNAAPTAGPRHPRLLCP